MFSSPEVSSSSMRCAGSTSASSARVASAGSSWLLIGTAWPLILIIAGALADRYTSEAFLSAIRRRMRSIVPMLYSVRTSRSIAQQVVQAGGRPRLRIDLLHDDGRVQVVPAAVPGQAARDHDRAGRHAAVDRLARRAVVDRRALADVHAHGHHRVLLDDHAFDDLR